MERDVDTVVGNAIDIVAAAVVDDVVFVAAAAVDVVVAVAAAVDAAVVVAATVRTKQARLVPSLSYDMCQSNTRFGTGRHLSASQLLLR